MTADRTRAERAIAFVVSQIRPDWDEHGLVVILRRCAEKPLAQVAAAAVYCARYRTDQRTPECIARDGEHWNALDRMQGRAGTGLGAADRCPDHGQQLPCLACQRLTAGTGATPERIQQIRAEAREEAANV